MTDSGVHHKVHQKEKHRGEDDNLTDDGDAINHYGYEENAS
tara:strand:+ start:78 stop:200 length:123 start_codon:yes stop_codon:yes gene_type:complete